MDLKNLSVIRQSFAQCVFNHQVQEAAVNINKNKLLIIKIVNITLVSLVLLFIILQLSNMESKAYSYLAIGLSAIEIIFLIIQLSFGYNEKVIQHKNVALKFLNLRDRYKNLIADVMNSTVSHAAVASVRDSLQAEYSVICDLSLQTGEKEYRIAQNKLSPRGTVEGEAFTWSDEEIDRFLPEELRLKK
jgi:hypothetical protein